MFGTDPPASPTFGDLVEALAAWVLLGCATWVVAIGVAALVEAGSRGRLPVTAWVGCPRRVRRLLLGGLGVALAVSPAPAMAVGSTPEPSGSTSDVGLPVPARSISRVSPHPSQRIEVRAGDCLWDLARSALPSSARPAQVAALVEATYRRNRGVIGDDPDLIRPGQRLVLPRNFPPPPPEETP